VGIAGNDNALRLLKTNKNKENQQKQGGFTNKNLFFLVCIGFYWFLNDAERYFSIYVDVLSYKGFGGTIEGNHKYYNPDDDTESLAQTR